jgi:DNA-directed RNA polymerase subunit alpha
MNAEQLRVIALVEANKYFTTRHKDDYNEKDVVRVAEAMFSFLNKKPIDTTLPITILDLTVRTINVLRASDINTIAELISLTVNQILQMPNTGRRTIDDITSVLQSHNLSLKELP